MPRPPGNGAYPSLLALLSLLAAATAGSRGSAAVQGGDVAARQAAALLRIRGGFQGWEQTVLAEWNRTSNSPCVWPRVGCDSDDVMYLHLNGLGLGGGITPDGWMELPRLEFVSLADNAIGGTIPSAWVLPNRLQQLDLHNNSIRGAIPASWALPPHLEALALSSNHLSGTIPSEWPLPSGLVFLELQNNLGLCGRLPATWSLPYLVSADFHGCSFEGPLPSWPTRPWAKVVALPQHGRGFCGAVPPSPPYYDWNEGYLRRLGPGELPSCGGGEGTLRLARDPRCGPAGLVGDGAVRSS